MPDAGRVMGDLAMNEGCNHGLPFPHGCYSPGVLEAVQPLKEKLLLLTSEIPSYWGNEEDWDIHEPGSDC